ncbi:MAG TPA: hypothetical protein V6D28_12655 [Leptolyngbyaceae cyanobacterium]
MTRAFYLPDRVTLVFVTTSVSIESSRCWGAIVQKFYLNNDLHGKTQTLTL